MVYLLTEHPVLNQDQVLGFAGGEIFWLHAALVGAVAFFGYLFSRSRSAFIAGLTLAFSFLFPCVPEQGLEANFLSLSYLSAGLVFLAAPDKKFFQMVNLIWSGMAAVVTLGVATVLVQYTGSTVGVGLALLGWGGPLLFLRFRAETSGRGRESLLLVPLVGCTLLGLTLGRDPSSFSVTGFHVMTLVFTVPCLLSLIEHSFRLAYIDELTEIPGRRALVEALDDTGPVFALAMVDVDHFKKFNDTHGHEVGDQVLRMVAARIASVKEGGTAYRYGGEEFTLFFPGKTVDQIREELERIRILVESSPLYLRSDNRPAAKPKKATSKKSKAPKKRPSVGVTVSIGVATGLSSEPWDKVMKRADQALYKAKESGRNQVAQAS